MTWYNEDTAAYRRRHHRPPPNATLEILAKANA
eukprot:CAMPEP_0178676232 /NCGR_PEP_ID=MMETSP0698-20121128/35806_1 /TAXON_ID=265572 /ORGANISM="Extubocellulus spinifer, Strain CCMP396" /LENGTH=32 /DNA_ID= /DNA_START= /DNA_END= /DNA_ORIENTATION=